MELEVERAHFFRARAEPELAKLSPDEPEPDQIGHRAYFELGLLGLHNFSYISCEYLKKKRSN